MGVMQDDVTRVCSAYGAMCNDSATFDVEVDGEIIVAALSFFLQSEFF